MPVRLFIIESYKQTWIKKKNGRRWWNKSEICSGRRMHICIRITRHCYTLFLSKYSTCYCRHTISQMHTNAICSIVAYEAIRKRKPMARSTNILFADCQHKRIIKFFFSVSYSPLKRSYGEKVLHLNRNIQNLFQFKISKKIILLLLCSHFIQLKKKSFF